MKYLPRELTHPDQDDAQLTPKYLESLLKLWEQINPESVALRKLTIDPAFQPRNSHIAPFKDRGRLENESEKHIARLAERLADGELEPLLVARIGEELFVVDGHHRLKAHKRAQRRTVPARVLQMTAASASMASKLVNCSGAKLALHPEQSRECAWQSLATLTTQGKRPLSPEISRRHLGRTFGTSVETIRAMLSRLPLVNRKDYAIAACDPGTGWPQWRYVKGNAIRDRFADIPEEARVQLEDARRAAKIAAIIDDAGIDAFLRSLRLLEQEALAEKAEAHLEALKEPEDTH